jgi:hypothetical protein
MATPKHVFTAVEFHNIVEIPIGENRFAGLKKGIMAAIAPNNGIRIACAPATSSRI